MCTSIGNTTGQQKSEQAPSQWYRPLTPDCEEDLLQGKFSLPIMVYTVAITPHSQKRVIYDVMDMTFRSCRSVALTSVLICIVPTFISFDDSPSHLTSVSRAILLLTLRINLLDLHYN